MAEEQETVFPCPQDVHVIILAVQSYIGRYQCLQVKVSVKGVVVSRNRDGTEEHGVLSDWHTVVALEENRGLFLETGKWIKPIGGFKCMMRLDSVIPTE